jgi:hypothetical protein
MAYLVLTAHFVGDFICQSDWMAQGKSKRLLPLAVHVLVYAVVLLIAVSLVQYRGLMPAGLWTWVAVNAAAHFATDFVTSRINSRLWQAKEVHWFFVGVGADQLMHQVTLLVTARWWL